MAWPVSIQSADMLGQNLTGYVGHIVTACDVVNNSLSANGNCSADKVVDLLAACNNELNYAALLIGISGAVPALELWASNNMPLFVGMTIPQVDAQLASMQTAITNLRDAIRNGIPVSNGFVQLRTWVGNNLEYSVWPASAMTAVTAAIAAFRATVS